MTNKWLDKKYPKVNYIGNKEKLSEWIVDNLPITEGTVLDAFAGGCSVSYELKKRGFKVYSNDVLYSSYVLSKALIENNSQTLGIEHIYSALNNEINIETRESLNWLENKLFYSDEVNELAKLIHYSEELEGYEKYLFISLIRRAMIRKLPYSKMNVSWKSIVKLRDEDYSYEKYGRRRAYHNQSFSHHMLSNIEDYNNAVFDNDKLNRSYQLDIFELLEEIDFVDVIYLDPPYPGTMNKYNDFYQPFDKIFSKEKNNTDLTNNSDFLEILENIIVKSIDKTNCYILSINSKSNPGLKEIEQIFKKYGVVKVIKRKHNYQVSGKSTKNKNVEKLIILEVQNGV